MSKLLRKRRVVLLVAAFVAIGAPMWLFVAVESVTMMRIWYAPSIVALLAILVSLVRPMGRLNILAVRSRRYRREHRREDK